MLYAEKSQSIVSVKIKLFLLLVSGLLYPYVFFAQQLVRVNTLSGDGYVEERTYIGGEEKFVDNITGVTVTKVNIITERNFTRYFLIDSIYWFDYLYMDDYEEGFVTSYDYTYDSALVFYQNEIYDDYDARSVVNVNIYNEFMYTDSLSGNSAFYFTLKEKKYIKEEEIIAYFIYDSLQWKDVRELPVRPFVRQVIDTLGVASPEFLREMAYPMSYQEIFDTINQFRTFVIDSVALRLFDPFQYLAEISRLKLMFEYYKDNIQKPYVRDVVLNQMIKMMSLRLNEIRRITGIDLKREPAFNNLLALKTVNGFNPRCINLDSVASYYADEYDSIRVKMVQINPKGAVSVQFSQIQTESLKAAARNMAYELNKWYDLNWKRLYGRKELAPGEFVPIDEK
jgi:hypothetical protein